MRKPWLYPFILVAGALQAIGVTLNAALNHDLVNPWLAALVSFLPIVFVFAILFAMRPMPLPARADVAAMPPWAPLGGLAGAVAVFGGLLLVARVGAGAFNGLIITANLLASLALDHFGWISMPVHTLGRARMLGAALMVAGISLIAFA